jgi:hypothetical protein
VASGKPHKCGLARQFSVDLAGLELVLVGVAGVDDEVVAPEGLGVGCAADATDPGRPADVWLTRIVAAKPTTASVVPTRNSNDENRGCVDGRGGRCAGMGDLPSCYGQSQREAPTLPAAVRKTKLHNDFREGRHNHAC